MTAGPDAGASGYGGVFTCRPCPYCDLRSALTLLDRGLVGPAARLVADAMARSVPAALRDAHARGWADALHALATALAEREVAKPPRSRGRDAGLLARAVLAVGVDPVLTALRIDPPDLIRLVRGNATLAASQRKVLRALLVPAAAAPPF